jgi:hypothetical protein
MCTEGLPHALPPPSHKKYKMEDILILQYSTRVVRTGTVDVFKSFESSFQKSEVSTASVKVFVEA